MDSLCFHVVAAAAALVRDLVGQYPAALVDLCRNFAVFAVRAKVLVQVTRLDRWEAVVAGDPKKGEYVQNEPLI